ncbi:glucokinase [Pseudooceanicola marinus]|uniref:glucokinase n=1 Tax=Pseudooceanicola marinus TaxID=396013 RepID=UPI001CD1DE14|nr:glucokinase [Pseudooceanicola marinus]MCA1336916.1 glucokinase [Pseudooceanicola marinus]
MKLVADVGGTNVRFALAEGARILPQTIRAFRNDDFATFYAAADHYLAEAAPGALDRMCVAVAGPVTGDHARLTNRDWSFQIERLIESYAPEARLINDLEALGYSVPSLSADGVRMVTEGTPAWGNQALVAGIGTGFNVSPVVIRDDGPVVPKAEMGHVQLATRIHEAVSARAKGAAHGFETVEHLFSGRGFERLWHLSTGRSETPAALMGSGDADLADHVTFYAGLMAMLAQDLTLAFLPGQGIHFAGGVARAVLSNGGGPAFAEAYGRPLALDTAWHVPVKLILDDTAALAGCAAA